MQVVLLGGAAVVDHDRTHVLGSNRQATVLAALAERVGTTVPTAHLIDDVWGDDAPPTARNTLQVHVSGLRRLLGPARIQGTRDGYRYAGERHDVDTLRFRDLARRGVNAVTDQPAEASRMLRAALALYRGELLGGVTLSPGMEAERERLRRLWTTATLARFDADLALGRHLLLVDELLALTRERPHDEEVAARLITALYRAGAQAEALAAYRRIVLRLRGELGVDPGPRLRELNERILRQDARLAPEVRTSTSWRVPLTSPEDEMIGREPLLAALERALPGHRLHTLVGPSGVGKSRLALELAVRCQGCYPDGAVVVDMAGAETADEAVARLTRALADGLAPVSVEPEEQRRAIVDSRALVVLDDLAPHPGERSALGRVLAASRSRFVATSTRPAGLPGERIVPVPTLATEDAAQLLLARARQAGATAEVDAQAGAAALRCADLLDGLPAAIEVVAPQAVTGVAELSDRLRRRREGGADIWSISFDGSLARLEPGEHKVLDLLRVAEAAVDAELLDDAGLGGHLAALVRDGLVARTMGTHGRPLYAVIGGLGAHLDRVGPHDPEVTLVRRFVAALVAAVAVPDQYLVMMIDDAARARRLVALEPALVRGLELARRHRLVAEGAELALVLPELHYARYGAPPPAGRADWLLECTDLAAGRRVDLLVSAAATSSVEGRQDRTRVLLDEACALACRLGDAGRQAMVLAQRAMAQLVLSHDLGDSVDRRREAVRLASSTGRAEVEASTLSLLYPTPDTPSDLAGALRRAVAAARECGHPGLLAFGLGNLAMAELDGGEVEAAALHAREAAALGGELHNRALATVAAEVAETSETLIGDPAGLAGVIGSLASTMQHHEPRRRTEALLRLAAGLRRAGRAAEAARCVGLYDAVLVTDGIVATSAERSLRDRWLDGVTPTRPQRPLADEVADLLTTLRAEPTLQA